MDQHPARRSFLSENSSGAVMTVQEVSEYLKLAESTICRLAREGRLPARKVGGVWRFSKKVLDEWFAQTLTDDLQKVG